MISFTDLSFLFRFIPIFIVAYCLIPSKYRNYVLLLASLVFYAFGEPVFIVLLIALTGINYYLATLSYREKSRLKHDEKSKRRRAFMIGAVSLDVATLMLFKILAVFVDSKLFPLGLSFYIFKMISYQIDVMRRSIKVRPQFIATVTYFTMFPQISQGPIMRYEAGAFDEDKKITLESAEEGIRLFIIGFAMKTILADRIGILWNDLGMYGYESISTPLAWLGAFAYSFELYFDFWGYSLMASGILVALGYDFIQNFNHPYAANSVSDFYRRWHMTLGEFFRDYVYFPMGGNRCSKKRMVLNLSVVWILTGIWHGNGLNYILWGAILGIIIIGEKLLWGKKLSKIPYLSNLYVCIIIPLTWVVFAIGKLSDIGKYFLRLFPVVKSNAIINNNDFVMYLSDYWWMFVIAIVLCIPQVTKIYVKYKKHWVTTVILLILFWIAIYFSASSAGNPFMYLNF